MKIFKLWIPVILWAALIFTLSGIPGLSSGLEYDHILRKMAHVMEYGIFTFFLYRAFRGTFQLDYLSLFFYPTMIAFFYAVSDEIHQLFVPYRGGAFTDVLIDSIGIISFYIGMKIFETKRKPRL
jgi:VanZ family protein